jgi:Tfp pilus assembly protein PilN
VIGTLNLATRAFRNDRVPTALLWGALGLLVGLSLWHTVAVARLLSTQATTLDREVASLDAEAASLRAERGGLVEQAPDPGTLRQWTLVANLVDRRAFAWTELLARLEEVLPPAVHLTSIAPAIRKGEVVLDFDAVARNEDDAWEFVKALQARKDFAEVFPTRSGIGPDGPSVHISLKFLPEGKVPDQGLAAALR